MPVQCDMMTVSDAWRTCVSSRLGASAAGRSSAVVQRHLAALDGGLRCGCLWDWCGSCVTGTLVRQLCDDSARLRLTAHRLCTVVMDGDVYTCRLDLLSDRAARLSDCVSLLDVGDYLSQPCVAATSIWSRFVAEVDRLLRQICAADDSEHVQLLVDSHISGPALAGFMLGYPVVYWCDTSDTCLSLQQLTVYRVQCEGATDSLFSFSVPSALLGESTDGMPNNSINGMLNDSINGMPNNSLDGERNATAPCISPATAVQRFTDNLHRFQSGAHIGRVCVTTELVCLPHVSL